VSVSTIYRYFADKHFAMGEFGIAQLARFTERMVAHRGDIYLDAPGAGVTRLVQQCLDPLRNRAPRALRIAMFVHGERRIIDQQIQHLCTLLGPSVFQHPLCGMQPHQLSWALHGVDGVAVWLTAQDGLSDAPLTFGALVEATSQMVFSYCAADRTIAPEVLGGARPFTDLQKPPGRR
jgi:AcrR family transcriptional regulator